MSVFRIHSLQQRFILYLMLPVTLILLTAGGVGFVYARRVLLEQWQEKAILQLQRAAHHIDMRMGRPLELIDMFNQSGLLNDRHLSREWILRQLNAVEGVSSVTLQTRTLPGQPKRRYHMMGRSGFTGRDGGMMTFHKGVFTTITPPRFDASLGFETVNLVSSLLDDSGHSIGNLEVSIRFDYLMSGILSLGWWQSHIAGIVNDEGKYLVHTRYANESWQNIEDNTDPVAALLKKRLGEISGTVLGPHHPPESVAGFYRLTRAPWTIVMIASGSKILEPIIHFRNYFLAGWGLVALLILIIIRKNVTQIVGPIRSLSKSAEGVAAGHYGPPVISDSGDEIGQLTRSYNHMVDGLKERDLIRNTFGRYVDPEIARKLLSWPEFTRMGGTKREVVVLMSDIRGFTKMSEEMNPDAVIRVLNYYFSVMIDITHRHHGIIVDFIGDGLLIYFEPLETTLAQTAGRAYQCATEMIAGTADLNSKLESEGLPDVNIGIGLNSGEVVVGNIGSDKRTKFGIVGAEVNLTQRIQSFAESGEIVLSHSVFKIMEHQPAIKKQFTTKVKGFSDPVKLYAVA